MLIARLHGRTWGAQAYPNLPRYRDHDKHKVMQLDSDEFIRRFLQHVLPDGFMRIRHYGFLASRRWQRLMEIRAALNTPEVILPAEHSDITPGHEGAPTPPTCPCPQCKQPA